mmetsp:Transcript_26266/g.55451  ORF Transcript_26266/g.55451 Transcript_26266/m.55451 type:complete len:220 (-) Transcript_26266:941-1600(-)
MSLATLLALLQLALRLLLLFFFLMALSNCGIASSRGMVLTLLWLLLLLHGSFLLSLEWCAISASQATVWTELWKDMDDLLRYQSQSTTDVSAFFLEECFLDFFLAPFSLFFGEDLWCCRHLASLFSFGSSSMGSNMPRYSNESMAFKLLPKLPPLRSLSSTRVCISFSTASSSNGTETESSSSLFSGACTGEITAPSETVLPLRSLSSIVACDFFAESK